MSSVHPEIIAAGWRGPVPKLADHLGDIVAFMYHSVEDAEKGVQFGGSGFVVGQSLYSDPAMPNWIFPERAYWKLLWIVTNRHVAQGFNGGRPAPVARLYRKDGTRVVVDGDFHADWITSDEDDLSIRPLALLYGNDPNGEGHQDDSYAYLPMDWFVVPEDLLRGTTNEQGPEPRYEPFGYGDETAMFGRYIGLGETERNEAVARFGYLSVAHEVPAPHAMLGTQQSLLVDARSLPGYSGSPVFIYRQQSSFFGRGLEVDAPRFLGVDWGHLTRVHGSDESFADWSPIIQTFDSGRVLPQGLMGVVPAWRLAKLLDSGKARMARKRIVEAREWSNRESELDSADPPASDYTREDFEANLRKVSKPVVRPDREA